MADLLISLGGRCSIGPSSAIPERPMKFVGCVQAWLGTILSGLIFSAVIGGSTEDAAAQPYPSRPVTMIVPFAAGGTTDVIGRIIADRMRVSLGQPIIVENVASASGLL